MGTRKRKAVKKQARPAAKPAVAGPDRARRTMRIVLVCYLFLALIYAVKIPFGRGPDETAHLRYVEYLAQHHRLPVFDRTHPGANYEFHQPPLYYLTVLPTYLLTRGDDVAKGQTVRFVTILLGIALLYLTYALARALLPDRPWTAVAAAACVAFLPMHLHLVASVSNDALTEVFFAAALLLIVYRLRAASEYRAGGAPPGVTGAVWLGVIIGLGMLTKSLAIALFPVAWVGLVLAARGPNGYEWRRARRDLAVTTVVALVLCGWWLARNQVRYGDPLAQKAFLSAFQDRPSPQGVMANYHRATGRVLTPVEYLVFMVIPWVFASTLGVYGPVQGNAFVFYPFWLYLTTGLIALAALVGFVRFCRREPRAEWQRQGWLLSGMLAALLLAGFVRFNLSFFQAQARYLFPALPAAAAAFCVGLEHLLPARRGSWLPLATAFLLGLLALVGLSVWMLPKLTVP